MPRVPSRQSHGHEVLHRVRNTVVHALSGMRDGQSGIRAILRGVRKPAHGADHRGRAVPFTEGGDIESHQRRRLLTVMFCDLVDSTDLSIRLDPEDLRDLLEAYRISVTDAVARSDGFIARFLG